MAGFGEQKGGKKKRPQQKPQISGESLLKNAINHHMRGDLVNAESGYREALKVGYYNHTIFTNLGVICKNSRRPEEAILLYKKAIEISPNEPDAYSNLGNLYQSLGNLESAIACSSKSLEIKPNNSEALVTLGWCQKELGNLDLALASTLKSLELKPDNPTAHMNLGSIYKDLGNLDQAFASTLKSLELNPGNSKALYLLGAINMALGETEEARKNFLNAIKNNPQEYGAYFDLSRILKTAEEAGQLVKSINSAKASEVTPRNRHLTEFAISNCLHIAEKYGEASKHLQLANNNKLIALPSDIKPLRQAIENSLSNFDPTGTTNINANSGRGRIFIVGIPRSGSTLLETILSMHLEIKDLGERKSLERAIAKFKQQKPYDANHQNINELYSQMEPIDGVRYKYTTDKQLYNFININWITTHMPVAKIIHCRRNPMDNILSMYRSNLMAGNNYTASLEDSAKVLIAQEQAMQIQKKRHPEKIFTFDYDQFVNAPEVNLRKLLGWLDLEFDNNYLHPEKSTRIVNTASVMQARKPISNKSVGGWKNYETLLKPAFKIIQESGIKID